MKTKSTKCISCTARVGSRKFNLKADQIDFVIRIVMVKCKNGHENYVRVSD